MTKRRFQAIEWFGSSFGSVLFHLAILFLLFLAVRGGSHAGISGARQTDEVGIVFSDSNSENDSGSLEANDAAEVSSSTSVDASSSEETARETIDALLPSNEIGLSTTAGGSSAQELINEASSVGALKNGSGGGQSVGFGGSRGSGKKFVYVVDRSDSMSWNGGAPMRRAISDAISSVQSLEPEKGATKFQIVVFNHDVDVFENASALMDVTPANKARSVRFLKSIVATGGTSPEQALMTGIKMRPDVVFFLTDADEELSEQTLERIQTLRRQCKVQQICVVEFRKSSDPVKKTYKRLAGENGGTYVFKDVDLL